MLSRSVARYNGCMKVYTIGHSTRSFEELVHSLRAYGIELLADVRSVPRSRHTPQFNKTSIENGLKQCGIAYRHLDKLGGLRHAASDSPNTGWRNKSFRGYADYMQTAEFSAGIEELLFLMRTQLTALMCAEAVPWRCHRSMIGDALLIRGIEVIDIFDEKKSQPEELTSFAQVSGLDIVYPAES